MKLVFDYLPNSEELYVSWDNKKTWNLMTKTREELLASGYNFYKDGCTDLREIYIKDVQGFISKPIYNSYLDICYEEETTDTCVVSVKDTSSIIHGTLDKSKGTISLQVQDIETEEDLQKLRAYIDELSDVTVDLSSTYFKKGLDLGTTFKDCKNLIGITLPEGTTVVDDEAFFGCKKLSKLFIPKETTLIGNNAFTGCSLSTSTIKFQKPELWENVQASDLNSGTRVDITGYIERYEVLPDGTYNVILKEGTYTLEEHPDGNYNLNIPTATLYAISGDETDETSDVLYNLV